MVSILTPIPAWLESVAIRHLSWTFWPLAAAGRLTEARDALDRVSASHPEYAMALFKRAQVSVLLNEPDRARRIQLATDKADKTTRALIANERLFVK